MSFTYYFAGNQVEPVMLYQAQNNCNILRSYILEKTDINRWIERKKSGTWSGKLLIDSGAYTAHCQGTVINIDEYISWINENDDYVDYFITLDKIPGMWGIPKTAEDVLIGAEESWNNYLYIRERVKHPNKILPVFHQGENFEFLTRYLEYQPPIPYMCISGNKELTRKSRQFWYGQCFQNIMSSSNPNIQIHCLGSGTLQDVEMYPFTSTDSTSWLQGSKSATIFTNSGNIYCGADTTRKDHMIYDESVVNKISELCNLYDIDINKLTTDFKERLKFNIQFYLHGSENTSTTYFDRPRVVRKSLF